MSAANFYQETGGASGMWAQVLLQDGLVYEGIILDERPHGIYLLIGGDSDRLSMFSWSNIVRVSMKEV